MMNGAGWAMGLGGWLFALYFVVQSMVEITGTAIVRPYWGALRARLRSFGRKPDQDWPLTAWEMTIPNHPRRC